METMVNGNPEDIVISGIAGKFPESDNMKILQENIFNKADLGTDDNRRWIHQYPDVPRRTGKINDINKFDAEYFDIPDIEAHEIDPLSRILLENVYEAIIDAGINPSTLRGTNTAVLVGTIFSESEEDLCYEKAEITRLGVLGYSKAVLANRISHWLGVTGPSNTLDTACSSSSLAIDRAYKLIQLGQCDAAIVAASHLCLQPVLSLQFSRLGVLSPDGRCKVFDDDANGYMRSETIAAIYLQKLKHAKRVYATVVYTKVNTDGYKEEGITYPSSYMQGQLLEEFYNECGISPACLGYFEAHGTGTSVGDLEEINALAKAICKDRKSPLLVGSIKTNLGHTEPAAGLCQVAKVIIAMETGIIPPNIHFKKARKGVKALENGDIRIVTDLTPWAPALVGINSFGFGGANVHILLRPNPKEKINKGLPTDQLPRLIVMSGRTEDAIESFFNDIESRPMDVEYFRLLHDIFATDIPNHPYRGYAIIERETSVKPIKEIQRYSGISQPICFVFSGIGSQWLGIGRALMQFPVFSKVVESCEKILRSYRVHVVEILTSEQESICNSIVDSYVGITILQIGLIELLKSLNVTPNYVIGYSIGELCCGYITGSFTIEQVILSAYYVGLALHETNIISGAMMYIEHNYEEVKSMCASDIEISRFSSKSCCISGPKESVKAFAAKLQANNILVKEINCNNIPLHSHYLSPAKAKILAYMRKILPQTKTNSDIWMGPACDTKISYADYFTNLLLSPVYFEKITQLIPKHAITIEIVHDEIIQKEFSDTAVALMQRNRRDNVEVLLQGLGKLYNAGSQPHLANLYPAVRYPVSRGTPMISPSLKWDHSKDWYVSSFTNQKTLTSGEMSIVMSLADEDYEFISGHVIDGRNLLPATGYLFFVWKTLGMLKNKLQNEVVFEDVKFLRATNFPKQGSIELNIMLQKVTGKFEVMEGGTTVVTGSARIPTDIAKERLPFSFLQHNNNKEEIMKPKDIYKELKLRGYQYSGMFRGIQSVSSMGERGQIVWEQNWVAFMDCMLQVKILGMDTNGLYVPTEIKKLVIDPKLHAQCLRDQKTDEKRLPVYVYNSYDTIISGGVEIRGLKASSITRRKPMMNPVLEKYEFVPYQDNQEITFENTMTLCTHLALEYHQMTKVNIIEVVESNDQITTEELSSPIIAEILSNLPLIQPNITLIARTDRFKDVVLHPSIALSQTNGLSNDSKAILIVGVNLFNIAKSETLKEVLLALQDNGFLLTRGDPVTSKEDRLNVEKHNLVVVLEKRTKQEHITLCKKKPKLSGRMEVVRMNNYEFSWLEDLKAILNVQNTSRKIARILLVGEKDPECGLLGFVNCLRKESGGELIRGMLIQDETAPDFCLHDPLYAQQLERDLIINVLGPKKIWGSYRHHPLPSLALQPVHHAFVNQQVRGDLSSFGWFQGAITSDDNQDVVHIIYASINFKDVMIATGKITMNSFASRGRMEECFIGFEYVGIDNAGRRVMGLCENRGMSNLHLIDRNLCWNIPEEWTLEDAATVPCAYATCYYALHLRGNMKKGDKILIHSGTGAVGQAAIYLALHAGCDIFTTVGTPEKRKFILDTFPSIPESHIGNSRDTSFEQMILQQTNGQGVDIVLNSLAEEKLQASIRCVARDGCFVEIGKFDLMNNNLMNFSIFSKGIKFFSVLLDNVIVDTKKKNTDLFAIINEGLKNGAIKPLCRTVFHKDEIETAFRYMAAGKHIGKIILKIQEEDKYMNAPVLALPRYYCSASKTYVILGGLGGFGLELTDWLVNRGARNVVLVSRSGLKNGFQHRKVELWKSYGVHVLILSSGDAATSSDCEAILKSAEKIAPVDAIFNLAVVLNDKMCQNHTVETFEKPFKGKAWATMHLDQASRKICPHLRHFVVFSSVSCGRGNAGQTNYGMANSIMERICEKRSREGLHGLAIQWGAIGDVGIVADMMDDDKELIIGGTLQQNIRSCIEKLEEFLLQKYPVVASMVVAEKRSNICGTSNVVETLANIIGITDLTTVNHQTPLSELGMDSMMVVEIKQTLEREFDTFLSPQDIRNLNFAKVIEMFDKDSQKKDCSMADQDATELNGIQLLVRITGNDPLTPEVCMDLPTQRTNVKTEVFLIPGLLGCGSIFNPLVQYIEASVTCLQHGTYNVDPNCVSINEISDCLLQHILDQNKVGENFVMVGYSFGAAIAIELTRKLEARNILGNVILIDGAPDQMRALANQHLHFTTIEELENNVLLTIMDNVQPKHTEKFLIELGKCSTWDEKLNTFINQLSLSEINDQFSVDMRKAFCTTIYKRRLAIHKYDGTQGPKLKSPVILFKATTQSISLSEEDYGLNKITEKNVEVQYVEGNHMTILNDQKVLDAINKKLVKISA